MPTKRFVQDVPAPTALGATRSGLSVGVPDNPGLNWPAGSRGGNGAGDQSIFRGFRCGRDFTEGENLGEAPFLAAVRGSLLTETLLCVQSELSALRPVVAVFHPVSICGESGWRQSKNPL